MSDYLVESIDHKSFDLVPRTDGIYGLTEALASERLPELLAETGLTDSFIAQYASQLALRGAVDCDLLYLEGQTIASDITALSERMRRVDLDYDDPSGYAVRTEVPEDSDIWSALSGHGTTLIDRDGYVSPALLSPFELSAPALSQGDSFIRPFVIEDHLTGIIRAVRGVEGLKNDSLVTHGMEQYALRRNQQGKPVSISDTTYLTVGHLNEYKAFVPYATLLQPFQYLD